MATKKPARPRGRRPVGLRGEKVSEYPQVMIRLPHQTKTTKVMIARPSVKLRSADAGRTNGTSDCPLAS